MIELDCQCDLVTSKLMQMSAVGMLLRYHADHSMAAKGRVWRCTFALCGYRYCPSAFFSRHLRLWADRL